MKTKTAGNFKGALMAWKVNAIIHTAFKAFLGDTVTYLIQYWSQKSDLIHKCINNY